MSDDTKYETFFSNLYSDYKTIRTLLENDSKNDTETEPYKSKYAAKEILQTMLNNLKNISDDAPENLGIRLLSAHGAILLNLGVIGVETEEFNEGERYLLACIDLLLPNQFQPELVIILMNAFNQMGLLWSNRNDLAKGKSYLTKAAVLYNNFKNLNVIPVLFEELFKPNGEEVTPQGSINLEKAYTLTLYYLAQAYGTLKEHLKSAVYCHITLKRQFELKDYDPIDWALNAATLSQYFMEKNGFKSSRHHLAAASFMMDKYHNESIKDEDASDIENAKREQYLHRSADISRCWTKYCLGLLSASKDRLMSENDSILPNSLSSDFEKLHLGEDFQISLMEYKNMNFDKLPLTSYENKVTDQFILTFDDARSVFLNCQKWIDSSKEYYTLESHASDYVEVIQDRSNLYRLLAFYEEDERRQSAMHKRRIDMLEELVGELNPEYYGDLCRQIWFELGETYSDVLDIKLEKLKAMPSSERPSPQMLSKINHLIDNSIKNFKVFKDSLKDKTTNDFPKKMVPEILRPLLLAFFHLGRLHVKYVVLEKKLQLKNTEESLSYYKKFVELCDTDELSLDSMKAEIAIGREMITLLPYKVMKLEKELRGAQ